MATPVLVSNPQFADANGKPYAAGTLATYVQNTSTPKDTWLDPGGATVNPNPITLDAAGRCVMFGDGDYRLILHDAAGNQIFDVPSTTIVSAAMDPVVSAPTIPDAVNALGIQALIDTETTNRIAGDSAEANARSAAISSEAQTRGNADTNLGTNISNEATTRATQDAYLQAQINTISGGTAANFVQGGIVMIPHDSGGIAVSFSPPFATGCYAVTVTLADPTLQQISPIFAINPPTATGVTITVLGSPAPNINILVSWIAVGY